MDTPLWLFFVCVVLGILIPGVGGGLALSAARCSANAEAMGLNYDWSAFKCVVEIEPGKWVPLGSYRVVEGH